MHVVRESEGEEDEEKEQERKSELHVGGKHINQKWAWLGWVCLMVLSAVSCLHQLSCADSSVTGYSLVRGVRHLLDQLVRRQRVSQSVLLKCFCFRVRKRDEQWGPKQYRRADTLVSISVGHLLWWGMSVSTFCLGGAVSPLVSVSVWCRQWGFVDASFGLLQCVSKWVRTEEGDGEGRDQV